MPTNTVIEIPSPKDNVSGFSVENIKIDIHRLSNDTFRIEFVGISQEVTIVTIEEGNHISMYIPSVIISRSKEGDMDFIKIGDGMRWNQEKEHLPSY